MRDLEEKILVQRALQSDPECFDELCRRYYNSLLAVANSILPDYHLAEDAAQEALAAACRNLETKKARTFRPMGRGNLPECSQGYAPSAPETAAKRRD